jgi:hypothetical protein
MFPDAASLPSDPSGMIALANALRETHILTGMDSWFDWNVLGVLGPQCSGRFDIMTNALDVDNEKICWLQLATEFAFEYWKMATR